MWCTCISNRAHSKMQSLNERPEKNAIAVMWLEQDCLE